MKRANDNCLYGFACPKCNSLEPFELAITTEVTIYDSGVDDFNVVEWEADSLCRCPICGYSGTVADFDVEKGGAS